MTDKWVDNPYELFILPPRQVGLLDQFRTTGWKVWMRRFGVHGQAIQISHNTPEVIEIAQRKARRSGEKAMRRLNGPNGWLWHTIGRRDAEIRRLEWEMEERRIPVPYPPKWYHKLILRWLWGYDYDEHWYTWDP